MLVRLLVTSAALTAGAVAKSTSSASQTLSRTPRALTADSTICNLAWSNSGKHTKTDCDNADVVFTSVSGLASSGKVRKAMEAGKEIMCYISVGTINPDRPILGKNKLADYQWVQNKDKNGNGGYWGDFWYDPDDLMENVLPIMKEVIFELKERGATIISTDNAKPTTVVAENDSVAAEARSRKKIDQRYRDYMNALADYAHELDMDIVLKNPSYYNNHDDVIGNFDGYIVESLFNWYPFDIDLYTKGSNGNLFESDKPVWIFQYEGTNGVSNELLQERMRCEGVPEVYLDTKKGWEILRQSSEELSEADCRDRGMSR